VLLRIVTLLLAFALAGPGAVLAKQRIEKAADLPRFSYPVRDKVEALVRDADKFNAFATAVRRDTESVLRDYDIADKAEERSLRGLLVMLDMLDGRYADALEGAARIKALQEKPAEKLLSGMQLRAMIGARQAAGGFDSEKYRAEVRHRIAADLAPLPYGVIENDIKTSKTRAEIVSEALILGRIREVLQPTVDRTGALSSELAPGVVASRFALEYVLPLKQTLIDTYSAYLAAHRVEKPDIWAARGVTLTAAQRGHPVAIAIWDSGVDVSLFKGRLVTDAQGAPATIAFDRYSNPSPDGLVPIPEALRARVPQMKARLKGFSDLEANVDSPEASEVKRFLSSLKPEQFKPAIEELILAGNYIHGTHVAGIAAAGNPYARLMDARIEFGYTLLPDPCPSRELTEKDARNAQAIVDHMKQYGVRVANMSWGGSVLSVEDDLEKCGIGKTPEARKKMAREYFEIYKDALQRALASAPRILFVAAAGNSNQNASFAEDIPAGLVLPNLITVGAVDKAGDEAPFTSYGPTVVVHANGYLVESVIPGGERLAESGTSMAAPQVTNLAAKMLALDPALEPPQITSIIRDTADRTADGRRVLINPKKAVAAALARHG
jgi:subtilisin family serine protease